MDPENLWRTTTEAIFELGAELLQQSPDDELTRTDALKYAALQVRDAWGAQLTPRRPERPTLTRSVGRIGGANPDYLYGRADLDGSLEYRLRITAHDGKRFSLGTYSGGLGTKLGMQLDDQLNSEDLVAEADGTYHVLISARAASATNHLRMIPGTRTLTIRETLMRESDRPAEMHIDCLTPTAGTPVTVADIHAALERASTMAIGMTKQFLVWTNTYAARPNEIIPHDADLAKGAHGDKDTQPFYGYYLLPDPGAALEVTFRPPPAKYWNIQACNHWLEALSPAVGPSSRNHVTSSVEADGMVRVLLSPTARDGNWIDTAGHVRGCISVRIVGAAPEATVGPFTCRVVTA